MVQLDPIPTLKEILATLKEILEELKK